MFDVKWLGIELAATKEDARNWSDAMKASYQASVDSVRIGTKGLSHKEEPSTPSKEDRAA